MNVNCKQCGAALMEPDAFCTKCGARRESSSELQAGRFCTHCGAALNAETKFCTKCGAAQDASPAAPPPATSQAPASPSPGFPKAALVGVGFVLLVIMVAVVGGVISAVHRAREKMQEREAAAKFEKSFQNGSSTGKSPTQNGNSSSLADVAKNINDLASAANTLTQNAQNQESASTPNPKGTPVTAPGIPPAPGSPAAIAAASAAVDAALNPPPLPKSDPIVAVAATGNQARDWALEYERTEGGPEADLVVRTGDINNLGFGWPKGFDPFSGQSTPVHRWPDNNQIPPHAPPGTDRVLLGTSVMPVHMRIEHVPGQVDHIAVALLVKQGLATDGYSGSLGDCFLVRDFETQLEDPHAPVIIASKEEGDNEMRRYWAPKCVRERALSMPVPIVLSIGMLPATINAVAFQMFVDDFQPRALHSHFQVSLNGTRIPAFEYAINSLDQGGPIGKLLTLRLLPEYWPLLKSGTVNLLIDDPTTHVPDGYAIDFVRVLVNPHKFQYEVSLGATVVDADKHTPIAGATVSAALESAATDKQGKCQLTGLPAGLVVATASAPGYDENSIPVDLPAGQSGQAEIQLHKHQENTAALEQSIARTGTATIYGIHFDTDSSKIRGDSIPALNAVLALVKNHPDAHWIISGHTDNQGNAARNQPLSEARAKSVVSWLKQHGADVNQLMPQGFGATRPVADNATANGRALNRRVEVSLAK